MADRRNNNDDFDWEEYDRSSQRRNTTRRQTSGGTKFASGTNVYSTGTRRSAQTSKRNTKKKRKKVLSPKQLERRKRVRAVFFMICLIGIIVLTGITMGMYVAVKQEVDDMDFGNLALNRSSFIYYTDSSGQTRELEQLAASSNRIWLESEQIPQVMKDAIVAIEDERFFKHNGVDLKRTMGATLKWGLSKLGIGNADYGGSTITQQVIKNVTQENQTVASRKIKEIMRAIALEQKHTKDEILTGYLNIVYFAQNCYGVEAAANTYFNKTASQLTLAEAASIAGITQYPSYYDPVVNPQNNIEKRNIVLAKMLELGMITQSEHDKAASSNLVTNDSYNRQMSNITSYFSDHVVNEVIADIMNKKGFPYEYATQMVYNGGLKIYATIDTDIQSIMEDVYEDPENLNVYDTNYGDAGKPQSAMVVVDPYTGAIKGLVGGLGEKTDIRGWNRATQAKRQPGSSIKPISVYAPAIDLGKTSEMEVVKDEEITIGSDNWKPKNSYNGFKGEMTVKEAVARSANIPAVKILDKIGLTSSFGYLQNKFHIPLTNADKNYSSLALGGLSEGVSPLDMAGAYCTFVNSGQYIEPYTYTQVVDANGEVILENKPNPSQAISAASAYITSDLLSGVVNSKIGTGRAAQLDCGITAYGKTGTTDDDYDKWFVGYTPYYVGAVWFGFDTPASLTAMGITSNPSITAWKLVMDRIHAYLPEKELQRPANLVEAEVCDISGKLPNSWCSTVKAYFVSGTQPKQLCSSHYGNSNDSSKYKSTPSPEATPTPNPTATEVTSGGSSAGTSDNSTSSGSSTSGSSSSGTSSGSSSSSGNASTGGTSSGSSSSNTQTQPENNVPEPEPETGNSEPSVPDNSNSGEGSTVEKEMD